MEKEKILNAAKLAGKLGMQVAAGHGLNYNNIEQLLDIKEIEEYNIGHSIVARAVLIGMEKAVKDMMGVLGRRYR